MTTVDPRIYDSPEFQPIVGDGTNPASNYTAPEPTTQADVLRGTEGVQAGAALNQEATRERAGALASLGAVASEWSVRHAVDYFSGPQFEPDPSFSAGTVLPSLNTTLSETDREFLLGARSFEEFQYKQAALERQRAAAQAAGDNPVISFIGTMIDPGYLAIDVASLGVGRAVRLANAGRAAERTVAGVTAAGGTYALGRVEQSQIPMSDTEVVLGALLNGAATGALYDFGSRTVRRADPDYPTEVLTDLAQPRRAEPQITVAHGFDATATTRNADELLGHLSSRVPAEYVPVLDAIRRAGGLEDIPVSTSPTKFSPEFKDARGLTFKRPDGTVLGIALRPDAPVSTALHELVHATVQRSIERTPGLRRDAENLRGQIIKALGKENTPELNHVRQEMERSFGEFLTYGTTSPEFREWAKRTTLPNENRTIWQSLMEGIASTFRRSSQDAPPNVADQLDRLLSQVTPTPAAKQPTSVFTSGIVKGIEPTVEPERVAKRVLDNANKQVIGNSISWSLHKTLSSFSPKAREVADILVDNPLDFTGDSVVSQARAIRADLNSLQFEYEDALKAELANRGAGIKNRILKPRASLDVQKTLEREVAIEMLRRERNTRLGRAEPSKASPEIQGIADKLDAVYAAALKEMQSAGVNGAEAVAETSGYFSRKWDIGQIETVRQRLIDNGFDEAKAQRKIEQVVAQGIRRANGWDAELASDVSKAILDRARRKGYFEDSAFRSHAGNEAAKEVRDILKASGVKGDRLQRALDVITGVVDEAGKPSVLKKRVDIDMKAGVALPDGTTFTVADLINTDLTRATEAYLDQTAGRVAMARKGLPDVSDQDRLRTELLQSIPSENERRKAADLFDQTINSILGRPVGDDIPDGLRRLQALTRMVGLASSGLWQVTEYSTAMARFGALKTLRYALKEVNFKGLSDSVRRDRATSSQLVDVLSRNSAADIRIRPFINRMEDNFDVPASDVLQASLLQAQQLVPYLNAQKWVQSHQARTVANLATDTLVRAVKGDRKATKVLAEYGLEPRIVGRLKSDIDQFGLDTAKWSDDTWEAARGPLTKMMDDAVLRNRTGEIPAFAQFSQVGKFIFTFRSFVLGAHNKVLAGTISRDGLAGISLLMLYQLPLVLAATAANSTIQGKPIENEKDWIVKAIGQMGSIGLFSEAWGIVTGEKQQFGAPGLIAVDRLYKLAGDATSGDLGQAGSGAIQAIPILSIIPGMRAIGEALKE